MEEKLSEGTRYIPYNLVTRPSSFVEKVARRLNELIIGVKMCNICISVHGSLEISVSSYRKYSNDISFPSVEEIDDVITFRRRSKQIKMDNSVVCFH